VMWAVSTNRTGLGSCRVTLHCVSAEIAGLEESALRLFHAPSPAGPWARATPLGLNTRRNETIGTVGALSGSPEYFALAATGGPLGVDPEDVVEYLLGETTDPFGLDANADRRIDAGDVTFGILASAP
jgi:hypothetical protein